MSIRRRHKTSFHPFYIAVRPDVRKGSGRATGRFAAGFDLFLFLFGLAGPKGFHSLAEGSARLRQPADRVIAKCNDGKSRICHIRGKLKKRVWVREGSVILIGLREFEDDKADIIHCYLPEEIRRLKAYGELPETAGNNGDNDEEIAWQYEGTKNGEENENEEKNENGENKKEEDNDKEGIVEKQDQDIKDL